MITQYVSKMVSVGKTELDKGSYVADSDTLQVGIRGATFIRHQFLWLAIC